MALSLGQTLRCVAAVSLSNRHHGCQHFATKAQDGTPMMPFMPFDAFVAPSGFSARCSIRIAELPVTYPENTIILNIATKPSE
jgi:hypothetical protein